MSDRDPMGCSSPGSSVHGILQARILEWVAMPSFMGSSWPRDQTHFSPSLLHWQAGSLPHFKLVNAAAAAAKLLQSCPTLSDPRRQPIRLHRPWDSPGKNTGVGCRFLLQCVKVKSESEVAQSCPTAARPWTAAYQAPPSMGFSRQEYWSGVPLPSLHDVLCI